MKITHMVAFVLTIVGALNWGLIGLGSFFNFNGNLVNQLLGSWGTLESLVYILVGASAVWLVVFHKSDCKMCSAA